jgi:hypothetical protein
MRRQHFAIVALGAFAGIPLAGLRAQTFSATPLNDLGAGLYLNQYQGGLYPNGSNTVPAGHASDGVLRAGGIQPLDLNGNPSASGHYVLLSIGMSNTTQEFCSQSGAIPPNPWTFMGQAASNASVNHTQLTIANGAQGGKAAAFWDSPTDPDYDRVRDAVLTPQGLSEKQVEAAWVKVANPNPTTSLSNASADAFTLETQMGNIVRAMKVRYPNLKEVFLSSRIYGGYATTTLNPEPYAYESGFAVKWLIESQIKQMSGGGIDPRAGDLNYSNGTAPWIAWGPYMWADGLNPRSDGLIWQQQDFEGDGTHPSTSGETKVGTMLLNYFMDSPFAEPWFVVTAPEWITNGNGNWTDSANWSTGNAPNAVDTAARFGPAINAPRIVALTAPITVGHLVFDNLNSYTLAGSNALTMQVSAGSADITIVRGSHVISTPLILLSDTNITGGGVLTSGNVSNSGNLNVQTTLHAGNIDGGGSVALAAGKSMSANRIRQASLSVSGSAAINPNGTNAAVSRVGSLTIAGAPNAWTGRLDLSDNGLVVDYTGTSPRQIIENQIRSGFAGASWNGNGINSSAAASAPSNHPTALGNAEAPELGVTNFMGQSVDATAVLVRYTLGGDANLDGFVDTLDFNLLAASFGRTGRHWNNGDFNYDGGVNTVDFNNLAANFGLNISGFAAPAIGADVPEPCAAVASIILATLCAYARRRRDHHIADARGEIRADESLRRQPRQDFLNQR